jgi:hypothetical protein
MDWCKLSSTHQLYARWYAPSPPRLAVLLLGVLCGRCVGVIEGELIDGVTELTRRAPHRRGEAVLRMRAETAAPIK